MMQFSMTVIADKNAFFQFQINHSQITIRQGPNVKLKMFFLRISVMKSQRRKIPLISTNRTTTSQFPHAKNFSFPASCLLKIVGLVDAIFAGWRTVFRLSAFKGLIANSASYDFFHNPTIAQYE